MTQPNWPAIAAAYARKYGINPRYFVNQIRAESNFDPDARSPAGATGIAQIMPGTAQGWGVNPNNPREALDAAARNMSRYLHSYDGDWRKALAAYNAGPGAVQQYGGVPPYAETQNYIKRILGGGDPTDPLNKPGRVAKANQPVVAAAPSAGVDSRTAALEFVMRGSPLEGIATALAARQPQTAPNAPVRPKRGMGTSEPLGGFYTRRRGETGQQFLDRILKRRFGLEHDPDLDPGPGHQQMTGGRHAGRGHPDGRAADYGDARNDPDVLQEAEDWLERNQERFGIRLALYGANEEGHDDHLHAETYRAMRHSKGRAVS